MMPPRKSRWSALRASNLLTKPRAEPIWAMSCLELQTRQLAVTCKELWAWQATKLERWRPVGKLERWRAVGKLIKLTMSLVMHHLETLNKLLDKLSRETGNWQVWWTQSVKLSRWWKMDKILTQLWQLPTRLVRWLVAKKARDLSKTWVIWSLSLML